MNYQEFERAKETFPLRAYEKEFKELEAIRRSFVRQFSLRKLEDMTIDQFEVSDSSELSKIPNTQKGLVFSQLDNHVVDMDPSLEINKYTIRCPFKPASCYIYFTYDNDVNLCNRTDFLYLNRRIF